VQLGERLGKLRPRQVLEHSRQVLEHFTGDNDIEGAFLKRQLPDIGDVIRFQVLIAVAGGYIIAVMPEIIRYGLVSDADLKDPVAFQLAKQVYLVIIADKGNQPVIITVVVIS